MSALGATSVASVQLSALGTVHAGDFTLVSPNDAGLAMASLNRPKTLIGMMSTFSEASPACRVELKSPESAEERRGRCRRSERYLPMSGQIEHHDAFLLRHRAGRAICASVFSRGRAVTFACTWAAEADPARLRLTLTRMSLAPIQTAYTQRRG